MKEHLVVFGLLVVAVGCGSGGGARAGRHGRQRGQRGGALFDPAVPRCRAQQWTLYLRDSAMPADLIKVGDMFDLAVDAELTQGYVVAVNQTVTLSRAGTLLVFAASIEQLGLPVPNLEAFGVTIADGGGPCAIPGGCETPLRHDALVTVGGQTQVVGSGATATVAGLSFTNGVFMNYSVGAPCGDPLPSQTLMAGFRLP
jgi:hypothetical protein